MRSDKTQKEIAQLVGVGNDTISDWAKKGKWKDLKAANSVTRAQVINNTLLQLKELQDEIGTRDKKYPTPKESDTMIKLSNLIRDLDKGLSLPDYITFTEEFLKFLYAVNAELAKLVSEHVMDFVQDKAAKIRK
jgi:transcriptional regulator with XRE-family HTH domain